MEMEENSSTSSSSTVWCKYPEELLMAILRRLPWMDKLRLRRVCTLWNNILRDPSLLKCSRSPTSGPSLPFCCLSSNDEGGRIQFFSPFGRMWHTFTSSTNFKVVAAASGLLLMQGGTDVKRTLILLNPLNRTQRQLPLPPELEDIALHQSYIFEMTLDAETDSHRILAGEWRVTSDENVRNMHFRNWHSWKFYLYSLDSDSWKVIADLCVRDEGYPLCTLTEQQPSVALVGKDLFLLSTFHGTSSHLYKISPPLQQPPPCIKLAPDQDLVVGGESGAQLPPSSSYVDSTLFESSGRLMLILRQKFRIGKADDFLNNFWELSMYEFDFSLSEWKVAMKMPSPLARSRSFVSFNTDGGYVCFHNNDFTGVCDLSSKMWMVLPSPFVQAKESGPPVTKMFLFEPRIDIIL